MEPTGYVETQLCRAFVAPFGASSTVQVASGAAFAHAAVFEHEDLLLGGAAEISAGKPRDRPANGLVRATKAEAEANEQEFDGVTTEGS